MALPKPIFTEADVHAIRALIAGTATADQQRRGMRFILNDVCHIFDSPYVSEGQDRETFLMLGRHQVGVIITSTQNPAVLEAAIEHDRGPPPRQPRPVTRKTRGTDK